MNQRAEDQQGRKNPCRGRESDRSHQIRPSPPPAGLLCAPLFPRKPAANPKPKIGRQSGSRKLLQQSSHAAQLLQFLPAFKALFKMTGHGPLLLRGKAFLQVRREELFILPASEHETPYSAGFHTGILTGAGCMSDSNSSLSDWRARASLDLTVPKETCRISATSS